MPFTISRPSLPLLICALGFSALTAVPTVSAQVQVYVSPPKHEKAEESWVEVPAATGTLFTEDFSSFGTLSSSLNFGGPYYSTAIHATYTHLAGNSPVIHPSSSGFGGYDSGNYLGIPVNSQLEISLDSSFHAGGVSYFGFYFSAGDPYNSIDIYSGSDLLFSFSTASLLDILPHDNLVTAINGIDYDTDEYYGRPVSGFNSGEAYAYLHFLTDDGVKFDRLVLSQSGVNGSTSTFENDNHSIMVDIPQELPDSWVLVPVPAPVPEPSSALLFAVGASLLLRRRRSM